MRPDTSRATWWSNALLVALSAAALCLPVVGMSFAPTRSAIDEKRALAEWPSWPRSTEAWIELTPAIRSYFRDHFGFRPWLVEQHARLMHGVFGVSPSPQVWKGHDGWLYYLADGAREDLLNEPLPEGYLGAWVRALDHTEQWLRSEGIAYVVVIAPDKHVIYPQHLPGGVVPRPGATRIDQVVAALRAETNVEVVDLRAPLRQATSTERLFHLTDTHWNDAGAYVAYESIVGTVASRVPGVEPAWPRERFSTQHHVTSGLDLAQLLSLEAHMREERVDLAPRTPRHAAVVSPAGATVLDEVGDLVAEGPDVLQPRAVIYRDSFSTAVLPFLVEHFSRTRILWQHAVDPEVIRRERPAVVIHEIVGRRFGTHIPHDFAGPLLTTPPLP